MEQTWKESKRSKGEIMARKKTTHYIVNKPTNHARRESRKYNG